MARDSFFYVMAASPEVTDHFARSDAGEAILNVEGRRPIALDDATADQIDQVRVDRTPRGASQPRLETDVESFDYCVDLSNAGAQAVEDAGFTLAPMGDKGADVLLGLGDRRPVGRPVDCVSAVEQFVK
jgi:hypothetical protein